MEGHREVQKSLSLWHLSKKREVPLYHLGPKRYSVLEVKYLSFVTRKLNFNCCRDYILLIEGKY